MKTSKEIWNNSWLKGNRMNSASTLLGGATTMFTAAKSNAEIADTSGIDAFNEGVKNTTYSYGSFDNLDSEFDTKSLARTNYTGKELRGVTPGQMALNTLSAVGSGISTGAKIGGLWGGVIGGLAGLGSGLIGIGIGNNNASIEAGRVNKEGTNSNNYNLGNYNNSIRNTKNMTFRNSISAYGGPLFNHSENFDNGITFINAGGTHEENPLGGVPVGVDQNGTPNLVEEGEVIWNDYVFSNRLKPTKKQLEEAGYEKYEGLSFSKTAEKIQQGAAERVNDQIAIDSMNDALSQLAQMQEMIRIKKNTNKSNKFSEGGDFYERMRRAADNNRIATYLLTDEAEDEARAISEEEAYYSSKSNELANEIMRKAANSYNDIPLEGLMNDYLEPSLLIAEAKKQTPEPVFRNASNDIGDMSYLRYAPVAANLMTLLNNLKKPDYRNAKAIERGARNIQRGNVTHIGDYLDLPDIDTNAITNTLLASSAANLRANQNLGLNASQVAGLNLASNYKANRAIGDTLLQGKLTQGDIALKEMTHNSGVNRFNAEMDYRGLGLNQRADEIAYQGIVSGAQLRDQEDALRDAAIGKSGENIADSLAGIGDESYWATVIKENPFINPVYKGMLPGVRKNGGCLTRRGRRR